MSPLGGVDVLVIGAGAAGSTIARLLAQWGYSVLLLRGPALRAVLAESLPPSIANVLEAVGIREEIACAGFYADRGNTSWWGTREPRIENYPDGLAGYHVERGVFDELLVGLAERAGVQVTRNSRAPRVHLDSGAVEHDGGRTVARFVVDATGRAGLLARQIRRCWDTRYRTLALCGVFCAKSAWKVDPHHTLVEAYERGWAWSVPLAADRRYVCCMVDGGTVQGGVDAAYRAELGATREFAEMFADCEMQGGAWGRDASLYRAERYAGRNWILVGDAGSFVDPLSSFGVKKAMISAWMGAVVVNTCLNRPERADAAIELFTARENESWLDHGRQAAQHFSEAAGIFGTDFWRVRSEAPEPVLYRAGELRGALDRLRQMQTVRFTLSPAAVRRGPKATIRDREVVLVESAVLAGLENTESMQGVHLPTLALMTPGYTSVGELYEGYVREAGETPLPNFLAALALLLAKGILTARG